MSKKVVRVMKIQFPAGGAKPGPALAGAGIQMPKFCTAFNDQTKDRMGETVPVVLTVYDDKDFSFVLKTAPAAEMIKKACGIKKGSSNAGTYGKWILGLAMLVLLLLLNYQQIN